MHLNHNNRLKNNLQLNQLSKAHEVKKLVLFDIAQTEGIPDDPRVEVRLGEVDALEAVLAAEHPCVELVEQDPGVMGESMPASLRADVLAAGEKLVEAARAGLSEEALAAMELHRVLCGHREGPYGVARWGEQVQDWRMRHGQPTADAPVVTARHLPA